MANRGLDIYDTLITGASHRGIHGHKRTRLFNVTVTNVTNEAVAGDRQRIIGCTITGNGSVGTLTPPAVHGDKIVIRDSTITGNLGVGAEAYRVRNVSTTLRQSPMVFREHS